MAGDKEKRVDPYGLAPSFERGLVRLCLSAKFWRRIGSQLDPAAISDLSARLGISCARAIAEDNEGVAPTAFALVLQRATRLRYAGKIRHEEIIALTEAFFESELDPIDEEQAANELAPILKRRLERSAIDSAMQEYAGGGELSRTRLLLDKAAKIGAGKQDTATVQAGSALVESLRELMLTPRMTTGVIELDNLLEGGLLPGSLLVYLAPSGGGKSMALSQLAVENAVQGKLVRYATLEIPPVHLNARMLSCALGVDRSALLSDPSLIERIQEIAPEWKPPEIAQFTSLVTRPSEILAWIKERERVTGISTDLLIVDYADRCASSEDTRKNENSYKGMELVYETFRVWAEENGKNAATASQANRDGTKKTSRNIDLEHVADSLSKSRVTDYLVTLNVTEDNASVKFFIAKNRYGEGRRATQQLPTDYAIGRIAPTNRVGIL